MDPVPNLNLEREEAALRELGHTQVSASVARGLALGFVLTLLAVPVLETWLATDELGVGSAWLELARVRPTACDLQGFEERLEERSQVATWVRPRLQRLLTAYGGAGNEQVYVGRHGWLFQRTGIDHLIGPPFLDPDFQRARVRDADPCRPLPNPDPVAALARFHADLSTRGVTLVVVPTPVKGVVEGEHLATGRVDGEIRNPSFPELVTRLEERGIALFDPTPALKRWREEAAGPAFLATDTHWRPEAMEAVAAGLADFLEANIALGPRATASTQRPREARNRGDLALLLDLAPDPRRFPLETVTIRQVLDESGERWAPTQGAPVLLLGDSFANIYSDRRSFAQVVDGEALDWGESAGLAEQLSHFLGRPVDRIVRNAGGAHTTRRDLAREILARRPRLNKTRVVVYQFAVRELSLGDWQLLELPAP